MREFRELHENKELEFLKMTTFAVVAIWFYAGSVITQTIPLLSENAQINKGRKVNQNSFPNNHQSKLVSNQAVLHNLLNPCKLMLAMVLDHPSHLCCLLSMVFGQPNLLCYLPLISSL